MLLKKILTLFFYSFGTFPQQIYIKTTLEFFHLFERMSTSDMKLVFSQPIHSLLCTIAEPLILLLTFQPITKSNRQHQPHTARAESL